MKSFLHSDTTPCITCRYDFQGAFLWSFAQNDADTTTAFPVAHHQLIQSPEFFLDLTVPFYKRNVSYCSCYRHQLVKSFVFDYMHVWVRVRLRVLVREIYAPCNSELLYSEALYQTKMATKIYSNFSYHKYLTRRFMSEGMENW